MHTSEKKTQRFSLILATIAGVGLLGVFGIAGFAIHKDFQVRASGSLMDAFKFDFEGSPSPSPRPSTPLLLPDSQSTNAE